LAESLGSRHFPVERYGATTLFYEANRLTEATANHSRKGSTMCMQTFTLTNQTLDNKLTAKRAM